MLYGGLSTESMVLGILEYMYGQKPQERRLPMIWASVYRYCIKLVRTEIDRHDGFFSTKETKGL